MTRRTTVLSSIPTHEQNWIIVDVDSLLTDWQFNFYSKYRIAGNFREVQIFAVFATHDQNAKISTPELLREKLDSWKFSHVRFVRYSLARSDDKCHRDE